MIMASSIIFLLPVDVVILLQYATAIRREKCLQSIQIADVQLTCTHSSLDYRCVNYFVHLFNGTSSFLEAS